MTREEFPPADEKQQSLISVVGLYASLSRTCKLLPSPTLLFEGMLKVLEHPS